MLDNRTLMRRAFGRSARWQVIAAAISAVAAFVLVGMQAAISALAGAGAVLAGCYAATMMARPGQANATAALLNLLKAEAVKILVIVVLLLVVFKFYTGLVPLALVGGLACAALISGAAMRAFDEDNTK
jgi:ATP synthase protein I